jgi:hypothetical protein
MKSEVHEIKKLRNVLGQALIALTSAPGDVLIDGRYTMRCTIIERIREALRAAAEPEANAVKLCVRCGLSEDHRIDACTAPSMPKP